METWRCGLDSREFATIRSQGKAALKKAALKADLSNRAGFHPVRHAFATHLLDNGVDSPTVDELMGQADVSTARIYLSVMKKPGAGALSPLDFNSQVKLLISPD